MEALDSYSYDFRFGKKYLSDFGGVIVNQDGWKLNSGVTSEKITEKIPTKHGEVLIGFTFNPRIIDVHILIEEDIDLDELYAWLLDGEQELELIDSGKKIMAVLDNQIDITGYTDGGFKGTLDLSFICYDPFYRHVNERPIAISNPAIDAIINVKSKGNWECFPTIKLMSKINGKVRFKWNDMIITLSSITANREVIIDCENEEVFEYRNGTKYNLFSIFTSTDYYEFPSIKPFVQSKITLLEGSLSNISVLPNSKYI